MSPQEQDARTSKEKRDYKETLNLPRTDFPMKANLPRREPEMLAFWESREVYRKLLEKNRSGPSYVLHDGPPYANGHIHIGHALNKTLKDVLVKYKAMRGFHAPYVPGWDCHGLPIELEVDKKLGGKKAEVDILAKRRLCREYAEKFVQVQREEFKRLGVFGTWGSPYLTMSNDYEAAIVGELMTFLEKGSVYRGKKPVHWCPSCVTALAEAEVEYAEKTSPSIYVKFPVERADRERLGLGGEDAFFLIWTTTPWTLPANLALAVNPDFIYAAVEVRGEVLVLADDLRGRLLREGVLPEEEIAVARLKGSDLVGARARHPFVDRVSTVVPASFVSAEEGTGIVHIAPGHGEEDYEVGLREGLDIYAPVDDLGRFSGSGVEALEGQFVFKANAAIVDILREKGLLLHGSQLTHTYPHCWRCKKPVIFRATEQWFISMEHDALRENCLREVERTQWVPHWGEDRIRGMLQSRPDWCISRQRAWGVPITVLTCLSCDTPVNDPRVSEHIVALVREHTADVWFSREAPELLPEGYRCPSCGGGTFKKETDILDVWFDSGVSHAATLKPEYGLSWPADMYLEGSDQHRGWFQSSLLAAVGTRGRAPYRTVLTHGFVVDGQGKKMSKSLGNVIAPQDVIKSTGAEILRLWVSAEDYKGDVKISREIMARLTEAYRKIRNTAKFLLGNVHDFPGGEPAGELQEIDRWAMSRLQGLTEKVTAAYERYSFHEVYHRLYNFCVVDMSSFYLDVLKDRLYTYREDSPGRRGAQWVLREILLTMTRLMAPVLSFTAEEIWRFTKDAPAESVFLAPFPVVEERFLDHALERRWETLMAVRNEVNRALELKRKDRMIGNSLEAGVVLHAQDRELLALLEGYRDFLPTLFIVSAASLRGEGHGEYASEEVPGLSVGVERAPGQKCARCWNWSTTVGQVAEAPEICQRCYGNIT
ncbi:MAG: isoleucine--tRNA ligase [Nitrospirota bacterium]|jgi:isoleucyl-tRNA synthetase